MMGECCWYEIGTEVYLAAILAFILWRVADKYVQSIIGATEKRRESGAGVAVIGGIGGSEMGGAGRWGVYQDWGCWV